MRKTILILSLLVFISVTTNAQSQVVPFLKNDKYFLADENGKIIIDEAFDEIELEHHGKLISVKKDGRYAVFTKSGKQITPYSSSKFGTRRAFTSNSNDPPCPDLFRVEDKETKSIYYVNPNEVLSNYQAFVPFDKIVRKVFPGGIDYSRTRMVKVGMENLKINFIDTTGQLIFKNGFYDGRTISDKILKISNEEGKFALFTRENKRLTDYKYDRIGETKNKSFFKTQIHFNEKHPPTNIFSILDKKGKELFSNKTSIFYYDEHSIILNDKNGGGLFNFNGEEYFYKKGFKVLRIDFGSSDKFYIKNSKNRIGIVDIKGNILLDTIYQKLEKVIQKIPNDEELKFIFERDHKFGLLSSDFKELWTIDSISIFDDRNFKEGYHKLRKRTKYNLYFGLADSLGNIILEPKYKKLQAISCDLLKIETDSTASIVDLKGKTIIPFTKKQIKTRRCKSGKIQICTKAGIETYFMPGNIDEEQQTVVFNNGSGKERLLKIYDINGMELFDINSYRQIFYIRRKEQKRNIFIGKFKDANNRSFTSIFNDKGEEISPTGYGLRENFLEDYIGLNGGIIVEHIEDVTQQKKTIRTGAINFDGEWIIKPDYQFTTMRGNELFVVRKMGKTTVYNRYGKEFSDKPYDSIGKNSVRGKFSNNRIVVGYILNKDDFSKNLKVLNENAADSIGYENSDFRKINVSLGYADREGNEVISPQYSIANSFIFQYTTVTGYDDKGEVYSSVIDSNGHTIFTTDYQELNLMSNDSTILSFKENDLIGAIDLTGKILVEPKYQSVDFSSTHNVFFAKDELHSYLIKESNIINIGPVGRIRTVKLADNYFATFIRSSGDNTTIYNIFDSKGKYCSTFEGCSINSNFEKKRLPKGFASVKKDSDRKAYLINIKTGKELKSN